MARPSPMFAELAPYYDRIYASKDYATEARVLAGIARRDGRATGRRWLDVACGTGRHLEYLRRKFDVVGVDQSRRMLAIARKRLPGVRLVRADLQSFDLGETFAVVSCLFSAIGYLRTDQDLELGLRNLARHVAPGGVLFLGPWVEPSEFHPPFVHLQTYRDESTTIARVAYSERKGDVSVIHFHHLIGETGRGVRYVADTESLRLVPRRELARRLRQLGLRVRWQPVYPGDSRGVLIARRPLGR